MLTSTVSIVSLTRDLGIITDSQLTIVYHAAWVCRSEY